MTSIEADLVRLAADDEPRPVFVIPVPFPLRDGHLAMLQLPDTLTHADVDRLCRALHAWVQDARAG